MTVYDQYEVEQIGALSSSYVSKLIYKNGTIFNTGSYSRRLLADKATKFIKLEALAGLKVSVSDFYSLYINAFTFANDPSFCSTVGRNHSFFSDELISDTMVSNPLEFYSKNVDTLVLNEPGCSFTDKEMTARLSLPDIAPSSSVIIVLGALNCSSSNAVSESLVDADWLYQYPYQSRFKPNNYNQKLYQPSFKSNVYYTCHTARAYGSASVKQVGTAAAPTLPRVNQFSQLMMSFVSPASPGLFETGENSVVYNYVLDIVNFLPPLTTASYTAILPAGIPSARINDVAPDIVDAYKYFFGVGKNLGRSSGGDLIFPRKYIGGLNEDLDLVTGVQIRGWKYGLQSALPLTTKCVYRIGRFGQFRDMLEGRPTLSTITPGGERLALTSLATRARTVFTPLQVAFVSGTLINSQSRDYVSATNPTYNPYDSGIYDIFYRSGQPFFDRDNED